MDYRNRVLHRRGFKCERCGATHNLHVHHPEYGDGRDPWQYPVDFCELLCRSCHAIEHGHIPPDSGWDLLYSDLEENCPSGPIDCSACGREITWHFTIYHPEWGEWIVGSGCAERLSLGAEAQYLFSLHRRTDSFVHSPRWKKVGRTMTIKQDGEVCVIEGYPGSLAVKIGTRVGQESYSTPEAAKQRIFDVLEHRRLKTRGEQDAPSNGG